MHIPKEFEQRNILAQVSASAPITARQVDTLRLGKGALEAWLKPPLVTYLGSSYVVHHMQVKARFYGMKDILETHWAAPLVYTPPAKIDPRYNYNILKDELKALSEDQTKTFGHAVEDLFLKTQKYVGFPESQSLFNDMKFALDKVYRWFNFFDQLNFSFLTNRDCVKKELEESLRDLDRIVIQK